jgi:hypothetical protein
MIAEHASVYDLTGTPVYDLTSTPVYDLTSTSATDSAAAIERRPSAVLAVVRRIAGACARFVKTPVLPHAELWAASVTVDLLRERERQPRSEAYGLDLDNPRDAWLYR